MNTQLKCCFAECVLALQSSYIASQSPRGCHDASLGVLLSQSSSPINNAMHSINQTSKNPLARVPVARSYDYVQYVRTLTVAGGCIHVL
jgi:hypothetical protein